MRAVWIRKYGGPEVLEVRTTPDPEPGWQELRVRIRAAGLNFAEVSARKGLYPVAPKPPCVVGYEASGVVDTLGPGARGFRVGQRVVFLKQFGAHADCAVVPTSQVVPIPDSMSFEEAAALPVNYLTAYRMIFDIARIRTGDTLLVHMAAGGVGTAVLQLCRSIRSGESRVTTFGTCSASKHAYVRAQGCDYPIDYHTKDYVEEIRRMTLGEGLSFVFDPLGGQDWKKGYSLLREGGLLLCYGMANVQTPGRRNLWHAARTFLGVPRFSPLTLLRDNRSVAGISLSGLWERSDLLRQELTEIVRLCAEGIVRPQIDSIHAFDDAQTAYSRIENGENKGKVILVPSLDESQTDV